MINARLSDSANKQSKQVIFMRNTMVSIRTMTVAAAWVGAAVFAASWAKAQTSPWTTANAPSGFYPLAPFVLTDGRLLIDNSYSVSWDTLTADSTGNYATGTWSPAADAPIYRLYNASAVLDDGRVFFAGGEYSTHGADTNECDIYDPLANTWTKVGGPGWKHIGDAPCVVLPNGNVMLGSIATPQAAIYDPVSNKWSGRTTMLPTEYSATEESGRFARQQRLDRGVLRSGR